MTLAYRDVADAIADTIRAIAPDELSVYHYLNPSPSLPAVLIGLETDRFDIHTMDGHEDQFWRVWICLELVDSEDAGLAMLDYLDSQGARSIQAAFEAEDAPWRDTAIGDAYVYGYARVPADIQGPGWFSFGGPEMWCMALLIRVIYQN